MPSWYGHWVWFSAILKLPLILQGELGTLDFENPSLFLLWVKVWHQQKTVKTPLGEAFIAEPVPGTTLGAAAGAALSFSRSRSSEAELITSGMEQL